jgi:hypothetical protein
MMRAPLSQRLLRIAIRFRHVAGLRALEGRETLANGVNRNPERDVPCNRAVRKRKGAIAQ